MTKDEACHMSSKGEEAHERNRDPSNPVSLLKTISVQNTMNQGNHHQMVKCRIQFPT